MGEHSFIALSNISPAIARLYEETEHNLHISSDGCWVWKGCVSIRGVPIGTRGDSSKKSLRRMAWAALHGKEPERSVTMTCNSPGCFSPWHTDLARVGNRTGNDQPRDGSKGYVDSKSPSEIDSIITRYALGESQTVIAKAFAVHPSTICRIIQRHGKRV